MVFIKHCTSIGSGFSVYNGNYILTNAHVIIKNTADIVDITLSSGEQVEGKVMPYSEKGVDLALIKLPDEIILPVFEFEDIQDILPVRVLAIGSPYGLKDSITEGIISNSNRTAEEMKFDTNIMRADIKFVQTTAPICPGSSGGPMVNPATGKVIAVSTFYGNDTHTLSFGIQSTFAEEFIKNATQYFLRLQCS